MLWGSSCGLRVMQHIQLYPGVFTDTAEGFWVFILTFLEGFVAFNGGKMY